MKTFSVQLLSVPGAGIRPAWETVKAGLPYTVAVRLASHIAGVWPGYRTRVVPDTVQPYVEVTPLTDVNAALKAAAERAAARRYGRRPKPVIEQRGGSILIRFGNR